MSLSVLTLNIWNHSGPWKERAALIRDLIRELDPDLIALQEVLVGQGVHLAEELLDGMDYQSDFESQGPFWLDRSLEIGVAAAARWPLRDREGLVLPNEGDERRVALAVTVDAPLGPIAFATTHLNWRPTHGFLRERQVVALGELVLRRRPRGGFPPLLCGDFNARPDSAEIRYVRGLQSLEGRSLYLLDAWEHGGDGGPGITMSARNDYVDTPPSADMRIDYVFVGPRASAEHPGAIERCRVVCDEKRRGVFPSDHFGVYAELTTV